MIGSGLVKNRSLMYIHIYHFNIMYMYSLMYICIHFFKFSSAKEDNKVGDY